MDYIIKLIIVEGDFMKVYETKVVDLGSEAAMFLEENMLILFGEEVPKDLANYSYIIKVNTLNGTIESGMDVIIDGKTYKITAVGDVVNKNLSNLGHITLKFDGSTKAELPGTLYLEEKALPNVNLGSTITVQK